MKLISYQNDACMAAVGMILDEGVVDIAHCALTAGFPGDFSSMNAILANNSFSILDKMRGWLKENRWPNYKKPENLKLLAPVPKPEKILGAAQNYYDACERVKIPPPEVLLSFGKFPTAVNSPGGKVDICGHTVTWEGELGVVIGRNCRKVLAKDAFSYIAGYTVVNDISANDCAKIDVQLLRCKSHDGFLPMGPVLVTADEIQNPGNLHITTTLNGEIVQDSNTKQMIVDVPHLIEYFSSFLTLVPGDIIATGTPAGTAAHFDPPKYLKPGDVVEVTVENIGTLQSIIA